MARWLMWIIVWFKRVVMGRVPAVAPLELLAPPTLKPQPEPLPAVIELPPPAPAPLADPIYIRGKPAKWVKPRGERPPPKPKDPGIPKREPKPKAPRPELRREDPEQWGQYYFRDAILDQLETYFTYLKRMKVNSRDAYDLHSRLGIHILPQSAVQSFDNWRHDQGEDELSAWWKSHRPAFGAVSYGLDADSLFEEDMKVLDASPEQWQKLGGAGNIDNLKARHRIAAITGGAKRSLDGQAIDVGLIWVPKFLYFNKWKKVPADVQRVTGGDVYSMTIYWDRVKGRSRTYHKRHKGGIPQDYAIWVERGTGKVRVLRTLISETVKIASKKEIGGSFKLTQKHWGYATEYIAGACGRTDMSPEDYLRRCFMEAALMYESASLGSMIRITATRGKLTAAFGVDIKRTSYFFRDREVVLNARGSAARIFHIVRPHVRKDGTAVPMHFRGLRDFEWAGYKIQITVPGRDHFHLTEFDVGSVEEGVLDRKKALTTGQVANFLSTAINDKVGSWQK